MPSHSKEWRRPGLRASVTAAVVASVAVIGIAAASGASGAEPTTMPRGPVRADGSLWTPVFSQDFDTDASTGDVLSKYPAMRAYEGGDDTSGKGTYAPDKVLSVHDSALDFDLRTVDGRPQVASVLPNGYTSTTHMRVSMRYRTEAAPGYKFVMILWPLSNNWNDGEIDWPEADLGGSPRPASAVPGSYDTDSQSLTFLPTNVDYAQTDSTGWHTATVDWTASAVSFYWDGDLVSRVTAAVPKVPMRVTLQAETTEGDTPVPADSAGHVYVDWVVAYRERSTD